MTKQPVATLSTASTDDREVVDGASLSADQSPSSSPRSIDGASIEPMGCDFVPSATVATRTTSSSPEPDLEKSGSDSDHPLRRESGSNSDGGDGEVEGSLDASSADRSRQSGESGRVAGKRRRTNTTADQLCILETAFALNATPSVDVRSGLADQTGMTLKQVQIWFQNKRARLKSRPSAHTKLIMKVATRLRADGVAVGIVETDPAETGATPGQWTPPITLAVDPTSPAASSLPAPPAATLFSSQPPPPTTGFGLPTLAADRHAHQLAALEHLTRPAFSASASSFSASPQGPAPLGQQSSMLYGPSADAPLQGTASSVRDEIRASLLANPSLFGRLWQRLAAQDDSERKRALQEALGQVASELAARPFQASMSRVDHQTRQSPVQLQAQVMMQAHARAHQAQAQAHAQAQAQAHYQLQARLHAQAQAQAQAEPLPRAQAPPMVQGYPSRPPAATPIGPDDDEALSGLLSLSIP
eukprot:CAMPEP_0170750694 /NCGR_PEP_ID=MMETSP0437-20130122/11064_1 /TAXON_ID=0 /ORGANISM="Sexangularia sp." /LENGTH=473 /DNA_ID=CAMNT_0011089699 /DNA_START=287 /DNA_END=1708 /DNA_ORIENTATION=+